MTTYDKTLRPQDDYFGYINNQWIAHNPIPPTESSWGAFYVLRDSATEAVHTIFENLLKSKQPGEHSHERELLRTYYESALSYDSYRNAHLDYLKNESSQIEALQTIEHLAGYLGEMHRRHQSAFWDISIDYDDKNSAVRVLRIHQAGLTLPSREYYLEKTPEMKNIRQRYNKFYHRISEHLPLIGADFSSLITVEDSLAQSSWSNVELRDIEKNYNPVTYRQLCDSYHFPWKIYFDSLGWKSPSDHIVIGQPSYLTSVIELLSTLPMDKIRQYLKWRLLVGWGSWIDEPTSKIVFDFFGKTINGTQKQKPLWKRAVQATDSLIIGEALGREYANQFFPESSKRAVEKIVEDIRSAYHDRIDKLTWMTDATKQRAHTKLDNISVFVGYPSIWKDLSELTASAGNHLTLLTTIRSFETDYELAKIGTASPHEEWHMNAHTVNAYHHPNRLEIVFPAAILQPPFYDPSASYAANLGGIGAVTGHEFTHGFDDQGADFDEFGNTNRWQTEQERSSFDALAKIIVEQANQFETIPGTTLQGKLVLGEAIADIGGLELATEALRRSAPKNDDITKEAKELFETFARCECAHMTTQRALELAKVDPHPPSRFRVNCVVCHNSLFYETYHLTATDKLYLPPSSRAHIW